MKRDQAIILLLALFIGGYLLGRATAPQHGGGGAPVAAAPQTVVPEPAAAAPTPTPAPTSAPTALPAPTPSAPPSQPAQNNAPVDPKQVWRVLVHPDDAKRGPDTATVRVVVFGAFGNQETADFAPVIEELAKAYGDKIQIRFKHKVLPLPHPDAVQASEASLAANAQGKFWPFLAKAMKTNAIGRASLESIAQEVGCDMAKFKKDLDSGRFTKQIYRDSLECNEVAAHSYPNILVNGVRVAPPKTLDAVKALVDDKLTADKGKNYDDIVKSGKFFEMQQGQAVKIDASGSPVLGNPSAKIEVAVFEDFQCPFCAKIAPTLHDFQKKFPNDVKVVYKHMPLDIHDKAQLAAEASMAAAAQGKFWEYHDVLFQNQSALDRADLVRYAGQAGLDAAKFEKDLDGKAGAQTIERDKRDAGNIGISSTPTVLINGTRFQMPRGFTPEGMEAVARVYFGLSDK